MKTRFRYRYDHLQEMLIKRLLATHVKFRTRADRSIEFAKKRYPDIDAKANEIRFEIFQNSVIRVWEEHINIAEIIYRLADKNIPFIIENHDYTDWIIYEEADSEAVSQIELSIALNRLE
ncbi:MAG: hypothetical protein V1736_12875 [Pseudomonadota bacterium]